MKRVFDYVMLLLGLSTYVDLPFQPNLQGKLSFILKINDVIIKKVNKTNDIILKMVFYESGSFCLWCENFFLNFKASLAHSSEF